MTQVQTEPKRFIRVELDHLEVLRKRLEIIEPGVSVSPLIGEAEAIEWALGVLEGEVEPLALKFDRLDGAVRKLASRLGNVERWMNEEEEDDD